MGEPLSPGVRHLPARLGDGHGRRVLLLARAADAETVELAIALARKAWAVSVRTPDPDAMPDAVRATEAAGLVVDWRPGDAADLAARDRRYAVVACTDDPGLEDDSVCAEIGRVLYRDGIVVALLPRDATVPAMTGFTGVSLVGLAGAAMVSARRRPDQARPGSR